MESKKISCDVCGREKQATNHWFVALVPASPNEKRIGIAFALASTWVADEFDRSVNPDDICGQECLHKRLSRWLEAQTPTAAAAPPESVTA